MATPLRETLKKQNFVVTTEVGPEKGADVSKAIEHIELLKDRVDGLNVTDNQSSVMRYPSLGICLLVKEHGGEPVLQMTCRDRNRLAIQADLLFAHSRGIGNVLCLTGDSVDVGDHKEAKQVFDLDSVQLIHLVHTLNSGKDIAGNDLSGGTDFCVGTTASPSADPIEPQMIKVEKKIRAGVSFIQTQAVYEIDELKRFVDFVRKMDEEVRILAGIVPIIGVKMAAYMNENVPGIFIPQRLIDELAEAPKGTGVAKGIEMSARMIRQLREEKVCDGVHVMFIGREERVPEILEAAGLQ